MKVKLKFNAGKFNPKNENLFDSKMRSEATYKTRTSFLTPDGADMVADILKEGGQAEVQKRGSLQNGAEYIVLKIYFINDEK